MVPLPNGRLLAYPKILDKVIMVPVYKRASLLCRDRRRIFYNFFVVNKGDRLECLFLVHHYIDNIMLRSQILD
jgi:hypothetical protein